MNKIYASTKEFAPIFDELLKSGNTISVRITGNSMFPLFSHMRDTLTLKKSEKYTKRDIVMYLRKNGELVIHRIVKKKNNVFAMCGDNQTVMEYPIYEEQIMGKMEAFERKGKKKTVSNVFYGLYSFFWCLNLKMRKPVLLFLLKTKRKLKNGRTS